MVEIVEVTDLAEVRSVRVSNREEYTDEYILPEGFAPIVEDDSLVSIGETLAEPDGIADVEDDSLALASKEVMARVSGRVSLEGDSLTITGPTRTSVSTSYPPAAQIVVRSAKGLSQARLSPPAPRTRSRYYASRDAKPSSATS